MTTLSNGSGAAPASTGLVELGYLMRRVHSARAALEAQRSQPRTLSTNPEQLQLLRALECFVAALESRHLPVPPTIRDELNLQRALCSRTGVSPNATRRRVDRK